MRRNHSLDLACVALAAMFCRATALAEVVEYGGSPEALPHQQYIHAVSEAVSPIDPVYVKSKDGAYVAAAIRKPPGDGPFPAVVMLHGAPGGRGMEQLLGWSRGDHGGPVWERYLQEGFVVVVADYRGGDLDLMNTPSATGLTTAIDDGIAVVEHVAALPYVDAAQVSVYGVSLGGNLALYLASLLPRLKAVVVGAPAPVWFLGVENMQRFAVVDGDSPRLAAGVAAANIAPIRMPVLIQVGSADFLLGLSRILHEEFVAQGKSVRLEIYEHGYHDFVLGPQGHTRPDLPQGEILMQGGLDALERSLAFIKSGK
jgi:dipeptidyl aminopeptidase/acylaminoacyl peptidase